MRNGRAWRVLIIEDELIDREIYKRFLQSSPAFRFEFAECDSAARGIEVSRNWEPDCILLDFNLKDTDGLQLLPHLRGTNGRLPCAVIMLTAFGGEELAVKAMKNGAMDYLPKGQVVAELLPQTVVNAIERFQLQRRVEEQRCELERSTRQYQTLLEAIPQMVWTADSDGRLQFANCQWSEYTGLSSAHGSQLAWDDLLHPEDRERTWNAWNQARSGESTFEIEHRLRRSADGAYRWHLVRAVPFRAGAGEITTWFGTCTEIENQKQAETVTLQREKLQSLGQLAAGIAHDFNNLLVSVLCGASYAKESLPPFHPAQEMLKGVVSAGERAAELTSKMLAYAGLGNQHLEQADLNRLVLNTCSSLLPSIPNHIRLELPNTHDRVLLTTDIQRMRQVIVDLIMNAIEAIPEGGIGTIVIQTETVDVPEHSGQTANGSYPVTLPRGSYAVLEVRDDGCGMDEDTRKKIFDPFFSTKFLGRGLGLASVQGFVRSNGGDVQVQSAPSAGTSIRILLPQARVGTKSEGGQMLMRSSES
jgi:PAS domain S-box-containing protein